MCQNFLEQVQNMVPKIYKEMLKITNKSDNIAKDQENRHYYIHGLDFLPDENGILHLIEINNPPGHSISFGIHNYQSFFNLATKFIINN